MKPLKKKAYNKLLFSERASWMIETTQREAEIIAASPQFALAAADYTFSTPAVRAAWDRLKDIRARILGEAAA